MARARVRLLRRAVALSAAALALTACATPGGTSAPMAPAGGRRCESSALSATLGRASAATGHVSRVVQLKNTSTRACSLLGYPGLQRLDANAAPVPTRVVHGGGFSFPDVPPRRVELAPNAMASFAADWASATGYPEGCPTSEKLLVTPPAASHGVSIDVTVQACPDGTIHESPIVAGASGPAR